MKIRIFTNEEFSSAGKIERLYMFVMQPEDFVLTNAEDQYLNKLKVAFTLFSDCDTKAEMYAKFDALHLEWKSERTKIFKDCQELFGRLEKHNPELLRIKLTESLLLALSIAKKDGDIQNIVSVSLAIGKINQLDKPISNAEEKFEQPKKVVFVVNDRNTNRDLSEAIELPTIDSGD